MLQHGEAVHEHYRALFDRLEKGEECEQLQKVWALLKDQLPPIDALKRYHVFHDCGKHLCRTIDDCGKQHFTNHAEMSAQQYALVWPSDTVTPHLIRHDMAFHSARGEELGLIWKDQMAPILYFTAWAEIYANAEMFGGTQSESFKIKRSRLIQAAKKRLAQTE